MGGHVERCSKRGFSYRCRVEEGSSSAVQSQACRRCERDPAGIRRMDWLPLWAPADTQPTIGACSGSYVDNKTYKATQIHRGLEHEAKGERV